MCDLIRLILTSVPYGVLQRVFRFLLFVGKFLLFVLAIVNLRQYIGL